MTGADQFGRVIPPGFHDLPLAIRREGMLLARERALAEGDDFNAAEIGRHLARLSHARPFDPWAHRAEVAE